MPLIPEPANPALRAGLNACRRHFVGAAGLSALVNLLYIAPTLYMLQVYDRVVPTAGLLTLFFLTLVLAFALATLSLLDGIRMRLLVRAGIRLDLQLAGPVLDATIGRPDLPVARQALNDFDGLRGVLSGPAILAVLDAPWVPIYIIVCTIVSPWIGLLALVGCLILPAIAYANERAVRGKLDQAQKLANQTYAHQDSVISAAETVRALGMRRAMVARQATQRQTMLLAQTEANFSGSGYLALTRFTRIALQSLGLGLGALLAVYNLISPAAIFAASFLIARALGPIEQLITHWKTIIRARQCFHNLDELLTAQPMAHDHTLLPAPAGTLAVEGITVINEARDGAILNDVSFQVAAGEAIAIVGPSGAGKSTLVRLIAGALLADRGKIRIDGADMRDWNPEQLAQYIGYLPQDTSLFAGTVGQNIARFALDTGADRQAVDAAVVTAAQKVGAHDLILGLPGGYDHVLKPGGRGLSAGQAQRIGLARAVYGDPPVLVLDEPNAHLDAEGDARLLTALQALKGEGRTILLVSHKLSVLPVIDRILVLRSGRIEMLGPRNEVMQKMAPATGKLEPRRGNVVSVRAP